MDRLREGPFNNVKAHITRASLESLTTFDLIKMADNLGIDIPPELDRVFIIEELLELISQDEDVSGDSGEADLLDTVLAEAVPLPNQYNITYIEVIVRDPLWAFVFWEIKSQEREQFEKAFEFDGYYLRVSYDSASSSKKNACIFKIAVKPEDSAWYLGLSPEATFADPAAGSGRLQTAAQSPAQPVQDQSLYKVELCAALRGNETVLAVSKSIKLPALPEIPSGTGNHDPSSVPGHCAGKNPLVRLSGYGDFHIVRKNERTLRNKRGNCLLL